ncbi:MAG: flagellar biosynthesis regulator FlaF [Pseudomonadota bacterium]
MNAVEQAKKAYGVSATPVRTSRGTEYEAFARITHKIKSAHLQGPKGFRALVAALHENRRLWTILAADVVDGDNALPDELRAQVFNLAEFTRQHTSKVLSGKANAIVLMEINVAVMSGLRQPKGKAA